MCRVASGATKLCSRDPAGIPGELIPFLIARYTENAMISARPKIPTIHW